MISLPTSLFDPLPARQPPRRPACPASCSKTRPSQVYCILHVYIYTDLLLFKGALCAQVIRLRIS